jgi:hypothetical protein
VIPAASRALPRLATASVALAAVAFWFHGQSLERANRLYRGGDTAAAAALYQARVDAARDPEGAAVYNLGTAHLALGGDSAAEHLRRSSGVGDRNIAQRSNYNLGYAFLSDVTPELQADSALVILAGAVDANRAAVRLDPASENARWNLALAQRMIDSLSVVLNDPRYRNRPGDDETPIDLVALVRSGEGEGESGREPENARMGEDVGARRGAAEGAREAWTTQDPGPMPDAAARRLIETLPDDPERLIRGILWSQRPVVAWWNSEPYPGGDW